MSFPIDLKPYTPLRFSLTQTALSEEERSTLQANITLVRDSLIFFTAYANAKGLGGHTGGAFDIVPGTADRRRLHEGQPGHPPGLFRRGRTPGGHPVHDGGAERLSRRGIPAPLPRIRPRLLRPSRAR